MEISNSDSEPEEINVKSSEENAKKLFRNERKAIQSLKSINKSKRKLENDKYFEQKSAKNFNQIEKLSQNLLNEVNFDNNDINQEFNKTIDNKSLRNKSKIKSKPIVLTTESTHFDVIDVNNDLKQMTTNKAFDGKKNLLNFKDQMLYNNKRHKRMKTSTIRSNFEKQYLASK
jgi:hypothetical protein